MIGGEARAESATAPREHRICGLCRRAYTDATSHVDTDAHLEAMARESVAEWLALPIGHPDAIAFAKQIARLEYFYDDYNGWRHHLGLPDTAETLLANRRISACWIVAIGIPEYEDRMMFPRRAVLLEIEGGNTDDKLRLDDA